MLNRSKRMSGIGDVNTSFVLTLEVGGHVFYFGEKTLDIANAYGRPTCIHTFGSNLPESFSRGFDIASDSASDGSIAISELRLPVSLPDVFRAGAGENLVGCKAELSLIRTGDDWSQRWVQASGTVENPTLMATSAVEDTVSFSINQDDHQRYDFPTKDYLVAPGWVAAITAAADPETAFGLDPSNNIAGVSWSSKNFLWSTDDVVLSIPADYGDNPAYVPFVFGTPGISGGDSDVELWKDFDGDGAIDSGGSFSVGVDERLRYYTTHGQTIAALTLGRTTVTDPDVDEGTKVRDIMDDLGMDGSASADVQLSGLEDGATHVFGHNDVGLWVRVALHAGVAKQIGQTIYMVDREHYGTPYSRSGSYTVALGYTARGRPYTYVDIEADYSSFLTLIDPNNQIDSDPGYVARQIYIHDVDGSHWQFKFLGEQIGGTLTDITDAILLWQYAYCCFLGAIRSGGNTADLLQAFFSNVEVQRVIESVTGATWQDKHLSAFNLAMDPGNRYTIKYPTADPLDAHCPANWTEGGQVFLDGAAIENPAELVMVMCESTGLAYDRGSLFELRDALRGWKIGGEIDDVTDVVDYVTSLQSYVPFTIGKGPLGLTATYWKWDASKLDAVHHFIEGVDLEVVGDGVVVEEQGMIRSLRLSGRQVTWLHQESSPFATTKPVEDSQLTAKELKKLDRLRGRQDIRSGWKQGHAVANKLKKFEKQLRSTYGSWDFSQDSNVTEQQDFWRINNYTGDVEAADQGKWNENPLTFPVDDSEREQWSRYMPHPLLIAGFHRYEKQDRTDAELELEDCYDLATMNRSADWLIAGRSQPDARFEGISPRRRGWVQEGDTVRVTSATLGYDDQVCLVVDKAWQQTNVAWQFRPIRLPARDTTPTVIPSSGGIAVDSGLTGTPEFLWLLHMDDFFNNDINEVYIDTGELLLDGLALGSAVLSGDPVFGADGADLTGGRYVEGNFTDGVGGSLLSVLGTSPDLTIDFYEAWSGSFSGTKRLFVCRRTDANSFAITVDATGFVHAKSGGGTTLNLTSDTALVAGQKTLIRFSSHGATGSLWMGVVGDDSMRCVAAGSDTTDWSEAGVGHVVQIHGDYGGASGGTGDVDEVAVMKDMYMTTMDIGTTAPMPGSAWVGPND